MALSDKIVLVTGASRGFGLEMTRGFLGAGARVVAAARSTEGELSGLSGRAGRRGELLVVRADIGSPDACEAVVRTAVDAFGGIDVLINNAALGMNALASAGQRPGRFWELSPDDYRRFFDVNAVGPFLLARLVVPSMLARGWGRIVNLTTGLSTMQRPGYTPYGPTKAALEAASVAWAEELAGTNVTVNVLIPGGPGRTRMITQDPGLSLDESSLIEPQALVAPALWLASEASDGITGQRVLASQWPVEAAVEDPASLPLEPAGW